MISEDTSTASALLEQDNVDDVCKLLIAFALVDDKLDEREFSLIKEFSSDFGYSEQQLNRAIQQIPDKSVAELTITGTLPKVKNPETRELLAAAMFEICQADDVVHPNERAFLEAMKKHWNISIDFISKPIEWDADQLEIITTPPTSRILIAAGPGMGKTAVACARVSHLIEQDQLYPSNIWMISFTRAAVSELSDRIAAFASDAQNILGVSIATIDSKAWKIRTGFDADVAQTLFDGYDTAIDRAIQMINDNIDEYRDYFGQLEHVIIDEAQDINGTRAEFLLQVIQLFNDDCGITVFHDPAQAIYDYELKDVDEKPIKLVDELVANGVFNSQAKKLNKIHRTNDPALIRLYEDLRLDVLSEATDRFDAQKALVQEAAHETLPGNFEARALGAYQTALVLFRTRAQATMASSFMCTDGLEHRLRLANFPRCIYPWVALVFGGHSDNKMDKATFEDKVHELYRMGARDLLGFPHPDPLVFSEVVWPKLLRQTAMRQNDENIDLSQFAERLASFPADFLMRKEIGKSGPIIGTIHSSKGRESDDVILNLSENWNSDTSLENAGEEGRVLFVGASRAKKRLITAPGLNAGYSKRLDVSGRVYRKVGSQNGCQIQVGLHGDIDSVAPPVAYPAGDLIKMDLPLKCYAKLGKVGGEYWRWVLWADSDTRPKRPLGIFSQTFTNEIATIGENVFGNWRALPTIYNIYVIDWRTIATAPADGTISTPNKLFSLVPVVTGFPKVCFRG